MNDRIRSPVKIPVCQSLQQQVVLHAMHTSAQVCASLFNTFKCFKKDAMLQSDPTLAASSSEVDGYSYFVGVLVVTFTQNDYREITERMEDLC